MKTTVTPTTPAATWNAEALYLKAQLYVQHLGQLDGDGWQYALWSSFALEFLARAALANVSPALLAENGKDWSHLYSALGFTPLEKKYSPKSIPMSEVVARLGSILPNFAKEHESFCSLHVGRRNAELHSGELAFDGVKDSVWQPLFYQTCEILLSSMGMSLDDFFGADEARVARQLITVAADESAKAVRGDVEAHKKVWMAKDEGERATLSSQALVWANRQTGHRVDCPSCTSRALVVGEPISAPIQRLSDDLITETQEHLPSSFECVACGLKITGLSRLSVVGLGDRYKNTNIYGAAEYYSQSDDDYSRYEDDNNEP